MKTEEVIDATPGSSPEITGAPSEVSPNSPDGKSESSTEGASRTGLPGDQTKSPTESEQLEELLAKENGEEAAEDSPSTEKAAEANAEEATETDEPVAEEAEATERNDLSQEQQEQQSDQAEKAFTARPEWQAALKLVPKDKQTEMRKLLRPLLERETHLAGELKRVKPDLDAVKELRTSLGEDGVSNGFALMKLWHRGDPKAKEILTELLTDLETRTGARLSSPDLIKRQAKLKQDVESGLVDADEAQEQEAILLELERTRAGLNHSKSEREAAVKAEAEQKFDQMVKNHTQAINNWEAQVAKSDPDYLFRKDKDTPTLQENTLNQAIREINDLAAQQGDKPVTLEQKLEICKRAYAAQKKFVTQRNRPVRTPIRDQGSSGTSRPKPQTDMEILEELERKHNG